MAKVSDVLDTYLKKHIEANRSVNEQQVYIHYSTQKHTCKEHIKDFLDVFHQQGYPLSRMCNPTATMGM